MTNGADVKTIQDAAQALRPLAKQAKAALLLEEALSYVASNPQLVARLERERADLDKQYSAMQADAAKKKANCDKDYAAYANGIELSKAARAKELEDALAVHKTQMEQMRSEASAARKRADSAKVKAAELQSKLDTVDAEWKKREKELDQLHEQQVARRTKELAKIEGQIGQIKADRDRLLAKFRNGE